METMKKALKKNGVLYLMFLPVFLYYLVFRYAPMIWTLIAFKDYNPFLGFFESEFVGLRNFKQFLSSIYFWRVMRNTVVISMFDIMFTFTAPIIFALLLNEVKNKHFKKVVQTITYIPHFISVVIIVSMFMQFLAPDTGLINQIIKSLGGESIYFLTDSNYFWALFTSLNVWQTVGWSSIIYLATLTSIDSELYEAAVVDGAGRWKQTLYITLPLLTPTIVILLIIKVGQVLNVSYETIILLYNSQLYETADVISTFVYRTGIREGNYSYATAIGLFQALLSIALVFATNKLAKKLDQGSLW